MEENQIQGESFKKYLVYTKIILGLRILCDFGQAVFRSVYFGFKPVQRRIMHL